jgi:membrane protein DedA with SNARE-associated domain
MILESAGIPVPSEVILPVLGVLVGQGALGFWPAVLLMALMQTVGSWVGYAIGYYGGRPLALRFGRYVMLDERSLSHAERWFQNYGPVTVFFGRFLPVLRTFISWPAGFAQMGAVRFTIYTFLGSIPWTAGLIYIGVWLGPKLPQIEPVLSHYNLLIGVVVVLLVAAFFYLRLRRR